MPSSHLRGVSRTLSSFDDSADGGSLRSLPHFWHEDPRERVQPAESSNKKAKEAKKRLYRSKQSPSLKPRFFNSMSQVEFYSLLLYTTEWEQNESIKGGDLVFPSCVRACERIKKLEEIF